MRAVLAAALAAVAAVASEVTLGDMALTLRRELHLGEQQPIPDVIDESCRALGIATEGLTLRERARRAYDEVRPTAAAAAAPAAAAPATLPVTLRRRLIDASELDNTTALKRRLLGLDDSELERTDVYDYTTVPPDCIVRIQLAIVKLMDVDTAGQTIFLSGWMRHYWVDPRLAWDPADWGGVTDVTFKKGTTETHGIWTPDVKMIEAFENWEKIGDPDFTVYSSGDVFVSRAATFKFPCSMWVSEFPFDNQQCTFTLGSWSFHGFTMDVQPRLTGGEYSAVALDLYQPNFEFVLTDVLTEHYNFYYSCCPEPYPTIAITLKLQRESLTFVNGIIIPMIVSTTAGFLAYFTNPQAGERIGLGITVLLVLGVLYLVATEEMPKGGERTTLADIYLVSTIFTIFTLFCSALAVSLANIRESVGPMSESSLLAIFTESDEDDSGDLDMDELAEAIRRAGLTKAQVRKVQKLVNEKGKDRLDFCDWYDIIAPISQSDGLAAYHSVFVWGLVQLFLRYERRQRRHLIQRQSSKVGVERRETMHGTVTTNIVADHPDQPSLLTEKVLGNVGPSLKTLQRSGSWLVDMVGASKQEEKEQAPLEDETKTAIGLISSDTADAKAPSVPPDTSDNGDAPDACMPSPPLPAPPAEGMGYLELDSVCCGAPPVPNKPQGDGSSGPADFALAVFDDTDESRFATPDKGVRFSGGSGGGGAHPDGVPRQRQGSDETDDSEKEEFWRGGWSTVSQSEVKDASETLGRRIVGQMDALLSIGVPFAYFMIVAILLANGYIATPENTTAAVHTEDVL